METSHGHECVSNKQTIYNKKMKASTVKVDKFKIDDFVSSKIDKVDKTSPPNPNLLLGKSYRSREQLY